MGGNGGDGLGGGIFTDHSSTLTFDKASSIQFENALKGNGGVVRNYVSVKEIHAEEGNARVWGGMHWRHSTEVGTSLGSRVGKYTATHLLRPLDD